MQGQSRLSKVLKTVINFYLYSDFMNEFFLSNQFTELSTTSFCRLSGIEVTVLIIIKGCYTIDWFINIKFSGKYQQLFHFRPIWHFQFFDIYNTSIMITPAKTQPQRFVRRQESIWVRYIINEELVACGKRLFNACRGRFVDECLCLGKPRLTPDVIF